MLSGSAFVNVAPAVPKRASDLALRFGVVGAIGSSATATGAVEQWIAAGRAEACPVQWRAARAGIRPCADFELGAIGSSMDAPGSGRQARGVWATPGIGLRAEVSPSPKVRFELGATAQLPLARNEVTVGGILLYRSALVAFCPYFGVSVGAF